MINPEILNKNLIELKTKIYDKVDFQISNINITVEGKEYDACQFKLNGRNIISRSSKITPKKIGQFVTFWKRNKKGKTKPFTEADPFDFFVINVKTKNSLGQFVFPKSKLICHGIISTREKEGKRGFRVYPRWDKVKNKQAEKTQKWQLKYFYEIDFDTDFKRVAELYNRS